MLLRCYHADIENIMEGEGAMYIDLDGTTFLILVLFGIILADMILVKLGRSNRYRYDERQELVRGRGFRYGFCAMAAVLILQAAYGDRLAQYFTYEMFAILCLCIGILVNTVYVIWHDGYFPVNEHPLSVILGLFALFFIQLFQTVHAVRIGMFVQNGEARGGVGNLILTVVFLTELLAILFRYIWKRREKEE